MSITILEGNNKLIEVISEGPRGEQGIQGPPGGESGPIEWDVGDYTMITTKINERVEIISPGVPAYEGVAYTSTDGTQTQYIEIPKSEDYDDLLRDLYGDEMEYDSFYITVDGIEYHDVSVDQEGENTWTLRTWNDPYSYGEGDPIGIYVSMYHEPIKWFDSSLYPGFQGLTLDYFAKESRNDGTIYGSMRMINDDHDYLDSWDMRSSNWGSIRYDHRYNDSNDIYLSPRTHEPLTTWIQYSGTVYQAVPNSA